MLGEILEAAVSIVGKLVASSFRAEPARPRAPDASRVAASLRCYEAWAAKYALVRDDEARGFRGELVGHRVLVRPGLDGSAPIGVEVEVSVDHGETRSVLVSRRCPAAVDDGALVLALASLLDESASLRSVAVFAEGVRLAFEPLTAPHVVERSVYRVVEVLREQRMDPAKPYR